MHIQLETSVLRKMINRLHFPQKIMLVCVRWYAAYALSLRNLEEMVADVAAARRFFERAIALQGVPEKVTFDKSGANTAAVFGSIADSGVSIELRQSMYLNNLI